MYSLAEFMHVNSHQYYIYTVVIFTKREIDGMLTLDIYMFKCKDIIEIIILYTGSEQEARHISQPNHALTAVRIVY